MKTSLDQAAAFHGHLGPYLVLGMRMGWLAKTTLNATPFELKAEIHTSETTPRSCILDGIQITSGCTLGKRNITVVASDDVLFGVFSTDNTTFTVTVKKEIIESIGTEDLEEQAQTLFEKDDGELFEHDTPKRC
jgi:formylmethanofuran dehydrogenase subunit E